MRGHLKKPNTLVVTLAITLLMATPSFAADLIITIGGSVINDSTGNSDNDTEDNDTNVADNPLL